MSTILYDDDKVCIKKIHDNALAVESKIADPAELSLSVDSDKVESNIGKVRFDIRRNDGVHEEYAYIMGRLTADKKAGAIYCAVRYPNEQQSREVMYMDHTGIIAQVPILGQAPSQNMIQSPSGRLRLVAQGDENLVLYLDGKPIKALFGLPPDMLW